jgi:hypothetical protein
MTYEEARLNLDRIDTAFTQRRQEREQVLQYAVRKSSLNDRGETLLPFAGPLAAILSQSTGQNITEESFRLPTTSADPEGAFNQILQFSGYQSPLPQLSQQMSGTRSAIESIVGGPLGAQAASAAMAGSAAQGV